MEPAQVLDPLEPVVADGDGAFPLSAAGRALLAVLSIGAATIHLVMVPAHAGEWLPEGLAFALAGWFALGFAAAVIAKPSKRWLEIGLAANVVFIAAWAVTRFVGIPFGPGAGTKEVAGLVDLTCVGLEAALVLACAVLMNKPRLGEDLETGALVMASIVPVGVVMLTTAVLASPNARDHHGDGGGHGHGEVTAAAGADHMDHADGADHAASGTSEHGHAAGTPDEHAHPATPVAAERCDWEFNTVAYWSQDPPQVDDGTHAHSHGSPNESANPPAAGSETVGNKAGLQIWSPMTDKAKCAKMKADIAVMESMATKYPTAQSALDAGCVQVTVYVPGIARHIACFKHWMNDEVDVNNPEMLLYGGNQPWAPLVGLSYYTYGTPDPNWVDGKMPWHIHQGLCVKGTLVIGGDGSDKASCEARGGKVMGKTGNMGHYWVPSCSSPDGVFSADNPRLDMGVQKFNDDPKFDPSKGGDPSSLYKNPCQGAKNQDNSTFGQPGAVTESAAGPTK